MSGNNCGCHSDCNYENPYVTDGDSGAPYTYSTAPGVHDGTLVMVKVGNNFPFRGLNAGNNMTIIQNANDVTFNAVDSLQISYDGGQTINLNSGPVSVTAPNVVPATELIRFQNANTLTYLLTNGGMFLNGSSTQVQAPATFVAPGNNNSDPYRNTTLSKFQILPTGTILTSPILPDTVYNYKLTAVYKTLGAPVATGSFELMFKVERTGAAPPVVTPGSLTLMADINEPAFGPVVVPGATDIQVNMANALNPGFVWVGTLTTEIMAFTYF